MLGENIRTFRKSKGYSQETLAQQLNVVRQTISKWEKGLSVPDAEQLERMAELFEVPVAELLGGREPTAMSAKNEINDIALQLAIMNEQFARQTRSRRRALRIVLFSVLGIIVLSVLLSIVSFGAYSFTVETGSVTQVEAVGILEGVEYVYTIQYDDSWQLIDVYGTPLPDALDEITDARELFRSLEAYYNDLDGAFEYR